MAIGLAQVCTTPRWPRIGPVLGPRWGRVVGGHPREVGRRSQGFRLNQAHQMRRVGLGIAIKDQLIDKALATPTDMRQQMIQLHQPLQVDAYLGITDAGGLAHLAPGQAHGTTVDALHLRLAGHLLTDHPQHPAGLWRQFIQAAAQHLVGQAIGAGNVPRRHLDVAEHLAINLGGLDFALVLMHESHHLDQRQILLVIPPLGYRQASRG